MGYYERQRQIERQCAADQEEKSKAFCAEWQAEIAQLTADRDAALAESARLRERVKEMEEVVNDVISACERNIAIADRKIAKSKGDIQWLHRDVRFVAATVKDTLCSLVHGEAGDTCPHCAAVRKELEETK